MSYMDNSYYYIFVYILGYTNVYKIKKKNNKEI